MQADRWAKVKEILADALERTGDERDRFLTEACEGDEGLLADARSFLECESDVLDLPAIEHGRGDELDGGDITQHFVGRVIGNYRIVSEIGSGGMGSVFLAERADGTFEGLRALKLIRRGIDSELVLSRFLNERRILASLKHPNIARLYDAGTSDDGVPYFVMEYVDGGRPITEYVRENELGLRDVLELFCKICSAVTYANQSLVIHRDLKPSNILVSSAGEPKLLDFGIAKLLNTASGEPAAATQQFALTPEYSSPEHLRGDKLTTATDVYSLGVVLFELLAGRRPYDIRGLSYGEIVKTVCTAEVARPSTVEGGFGRALHGDLDNIVLKALRKEPGSRYGSAAELSEDIRRYLDDLPVGASRGTWKYRTRKFVSRNRLRVTAAALVFASLLAGLAAAAYQAEKARRERIRAEQRFENLRELANSFMFEISDEIEKSPIRARELLITRAIDYLDRLAKEKEDDPRLRADLASAYERIGNLQPKLFNPSLGKTNDAITSHEKSLAIRRQLFTDAPIDRARGLDVVKSLMYLGDILTTNGSIAEARLRYDEAISIAGGLNASDPGDKEVAYTLARLHARAGQAVLRSGSLADSLEHYEGSLAMFRRLDASDAADRRFRRGVGILLSYIGYVMLQKLDNGGAVEHYGQALEIAEEFAASEPENQQYKGELVAARLWYGVALRDDGRVAESLTHLNEAVAAQRTIYDADRANRGEQNALADCLIERAAAFAAAGDTPRAVADYTEAISNYEAVAAGDSSNLAALRQLALAKLKLGETLQRRGQSARSLELLTAALDTAGRLRSADPNNIEWSHDAAMCELALGRAFAARGDHDRAAGHYERAIGLLTRLASISPENKRWQHDLTDARDEVASRRSVAPEAGV
ncbi:MAG: protein kinase domain-containing protein [Pyrinomonadaceae bacterium]